MSPFRAIARGLRALLDRRSTEQELDDEVRHYADQAAAAHRARGLSPRDALHAARLEVGNTTALKEQVRGSGWENGLETLLTDVRYAGRRLRAAPGFTAVALLTLALGIGAATAIFSAVKPVLFETLPYPHADRVMMIWERTPDGGRNGGTFGMYREIAARSRSFESVAVLRTWQPTVTGLDRPERLDGQRVSAGYFRVLGIAPALGRDFRPDDDRLEGPAVVILSDALWRSRFAADRGIVGREITLDGVKHTVIGVAPAALENVLAPEARIWAPLQYDMSQGRAWGHHLATVGRLAPSVSVAQASRELQGIGRQVIAELQPATYAADVELVVTSLRDDIARAIRPALLAILGAVGVVLAIVCVNVTNLLLARGVRRRSELALRTVLGASRGRLVRQLLTEAVCLALVGGGLGMLVAVAGVRALAAMSPPGLPRVAAMDVDGGALAFAFTLATLMALAVGLAPALQGARVDHHVALQGSSRRTTGSHGRMRSALVVAEVALAVVLLVSSGLLLRSIGRLLAVDAGFDAANLLTVQVQTTGARATENELSDRFFEEVLAAVRRVPGVGDVALTSQLPLSGDRDEYGVRLFGTIEGNSSFRYAVSPGYLETMRIPLRRGRWLNEQDRGSARVAMLNESFARRLFAGADPIGQRIHIGGDTSVYVVVGTVGDVKQASLAAPQADAVYTTAGQWPFAERTMSLVLRSGEDAAALLPAVREAIWSVDRDQAIVRVAMMDGLIAATTAERRFALTLFQAFAIAALLLSAAGIYGVLAERVAERTREMGVRSALGASRTDIAALIVRQGATLALIGIAIGIPAAAAATRAIAAMLFGITPGDPVTYAVVVTLLGIVALIAAAVPAARAARVDPATALRAD